MSRGTGRPIAHRPASCPVNSATSRNLSKLPPHAFVDALGELYDVVSEAGASVVGFWPNEGYEFNSSNALDGDDFVGLVIDQDNQSSLTPERVKTWVASLKSEFAL